MTETAKDKIFEVLRDTKNPALEQISFRRVMMLAEEIADALPVAMIPENVSNYLIEIRESKSLGEEIYDATFSVVELGNRDTGQVNNFIFGMTETFARAWIDGVWIVQETGEVVRV